MFTVALESSATADILNFVTSFGTLILYSTVLLINSGDITPSAICNDSNFELLDFFTVVVVFVLVDGLLVLVDGLLVLVEGLLVLVLFVGLFDEAPVFVDGVVFCTGSDNH